MSWKPIAAIGVVALGAGMYFSVANLERFKTEKELAGRAQSNFVSGKEKLAEGQEAKPQRERELAEIQSRLELTKDERRKVQAAIVTESLKVELTKVDLEKANGELKRIEAAIKRIEW